MSARELAHCSYTHLAGRALSTAAWRANRGRLALSVIGVALGVALAVAVQLINASAAREFGSAARILAGDADLIVRGPTEGFSEDVFARVARVNGADVVSPALEIDARVAQRRDTLRVLGVDAFRALRIEPGLLGSEPDRVRELIEPDAVILSGAAADNLGIGQGGELSLLAGVHTVRLRVIAVLPVEVTSQRVAFVDIATAQWRLQRLGVVSRIDVRVARDADVAAVAADIAAVLPAGIFVTDAGAQSRQAEAMTRAYRVNLNVLALVALFTGSFLVFATQALTILQRRGQIAVLRVLGLTRGGVLRVLLVESAAIGALGAALGLALGGALAYFALTRFGGDLGAGYYGGLIVPLHADPVALALNFVLGMTAAVAGCALPAWSAASADPAPALKAGDASGALGAPPAWPGVLLLVAAPALAKLPPLQGLPYGGYAAVAALLAGALWLAPAVAQTLLRLMPEPRRPVALLALQQLRGAPGHLSVSIAAILVSFSLMVAMLIMVASFRGSLEQWLGDVLPADVYVRAGAAGEAGFIDRAMQERIAALPAVARSVASRTVSIVFAPERGPVTLLARDLDPERPEALPLVASQRAAAPGPSRLPPVWISEVAADLHGWRVGDEIAVPLSSGPTRFAVAGIWRDYARENGALIIERARYIALTGDRSADNLSLWLAPGQTIDALRSQLAQSVEGGAHLEVRDPAAIRALSLGLFDRTFAVTYMLEAVAVLIGLFGIGVGSSSQVLSRRAEFGMLRHIGVTRGQIAAMLGLEGAIAGAIGVVYGYAVGGAISLVLVYVINRQSFHWSMDLHPPLAALAVLGAILVLCASLTAAISGRKATLQDPIRAVKNDW